MNTADYLLETGRNEACALLEGEQRVTYGELRQAAARLAGELQAAGVGPGERVGLLGENSLFWAAAYLAILKLGAVAVLFPTVMTPEDLAHKQQYFGLRAMCVDRRSQRRFDPALQTGLARLDETRLVTPGPSLWGPPDPAFDCQQDAVYLLTSGTTARPRAVRITHGNIQANTDSIAAYLELTPADRVLVILPFYYCFGTSLLQSHLRAGGSLSLCNTFAYPETALDRLAETECTGLAGVPSTYQTLLRCTSFPRRSFPHLRKVQQAGGKLPAVFIRELAAAVPQARVFVMYGMTEATARLSYLPPELLETRLGSIGKGIPGVRLEVLDEAGRPVQPGQTGEIVAHGENISPGYLDEPEANAEKFVGGALHTGDLATVDADGFIFIVDRKSDFIKSLGHRVSSQEVEACLLTLPDLIAAAVVGVPDSQAGEAIRAFVVARPGSDLTAGAVQQHCQAHLPRPMRPKEIIFLSALPVNAHGKVVKAELKTWKPA